MVKTAQVTPLKRDGTKCEKIDVNLDHVLWMEEHPDGTILFMNSWDSGDHSGAIINSSMIVAESERELLWAVMS
ncbi:MAG TPA: hypothetical protein VG815_02400 [Chloroflexota bacterium]|jgi:hypothetical protein|nr:hypothetical protein [Chloroflexota bacterium]